jgi:hypothetical protein
MRHQWEDLFFKYLAFRFAQEYQADGYLKQQLRELKTKQQEALTRIQPLLIRYPVLVAAPVVKNGLLTLLLLPLLETDCLIVSLILFQVGFNS